MNKTLSIYISLYKNLLKEPLANIPSLIFFSIGIFGIVALLLSFITDILVFPFMLLAIVSSFIALWYINILGTLKENLDKMKESINLLKSNNDRLHKELNSMEELRRNLELYAEENKSNFDEVLENFHKSFKRLEDITISNERTLLYRIAQDLEFMDSKEGMSREEYERFIERVPEHLKESFNRLNRVHFDEIAGADKKIDYIEVQKLISSIVTKDS
jgi:hypothetical protein